MRKLFFIPVLFLAGAALAGPVPHTKGIPGINNFSSQGVYQATNVYTATQTTFTITIGSYAIVITSYPTIVQAATINKAGTNSTLELFDNSISTTRVQDRRASIDTTSKGTLTYNAYFSSGVILYNFGDTVADITLTYRVK